MNGNLKIAVVIPCYKVKGKIREVLADIPSLVDRVYVVDDACPEQSGNCAEKELSDPRVRVLRRSYNGGVGAAVKTGYEAALQDQMDIIVKLDGDGQMSASDLPVLIRPILGGRADYTKGNRFYNLDTLHRMPLIRLVGNAGLSFLSKLSSGYWGIFDPTNGYTAIHATALSRLPLQKVSNRYYFESDMLFRLNTVRAVVVDVPMEARYGDERSGLSIIRIFPEFLWKHGRNFLKRIFYSYYLREMSVASFELPLGLILAGFGLTYGVYAWTHSASVGILTPPGTVMLAALPLIMGLQLLLAFLNYDINSVPVIPLQELLGGPLKALGRSHAE